MMVALLERAAARTAGTLLTPHPLEAARLLGVDAAAVQADRIGARARWRRKSMRWWR
jgi:NAD(P)H-hydrate repair Nnr-like enzyme with NAD(P)H-hydrate dehydratase domain